MPPDDNDPGQTQRRNEQTVAHPGRYDSFDAVEAQAREVLRERGLDDRQIERELHRPRREGYDA